MQGDEFIKTYLDEVKWIANDLYFQDKIGWMVAELENVRRHGGRVFVLGIGGSAGNASHMVNDLRKLCGIEAYAPTDNVSELTARTNDDGFETIFSRWLDVSQLNAKDCLFILSVGGGSIERKISMAIVEAIRFAQDRDAYVMGICGKLDGYLAEKGDCVIVVPKAHPDRITPHSEEFQSVIWHLMVSHPLLQVEKTVW